MLFFVPRKSLDTARWNAFVANSPQNIVYGYAWYLDIVCPRWEAVVQTDEAGRWQAVFAVPLRQKYGFWVVHQPLFCQFLPVFSLPHPDVPPQFDAFWKAIKNRFWYVSILNVPHWLGAEKTNFAPIHNNLVLQLGGSYAQIRGKYSADRERNLVKAQKSNWQIDESQDLEPLIGMFKANHAHLMQNGVSEKAYGILRRLYAEANAQNLALLCYAKSDGKTEAGALFWVSGQRIIYIFNAATKHGRAANARTIIIDKLFQQKAGQNLLFDFESPEKSSVADFYRSFGATPEAHVALRYNKFPVLERVFRFLNPRKTKPNASGI